MFAAGRYVFAVLEGGFNGNFQRVANGMIYLLDTAGPYRLEQLGSVGTGKGGLWAVEVGGPSAGRPQPSWPCPPPHADDALFLPHVYIANPNLARPSLFLPWVGSGAGRALSLLDRVWLKLERINHHDTA
jgi:hypothetical protein